MTPRPASPADAVAWYQVGWRMFLRDPVMWVGMTVLFFVVAVVLNLVPLIGGLVFGLCTPTFGAGFLYAADQAHRRQPVSVLHLFQGFVNRETLNPLLILGLVPLAISLVGGLLIMLLLGGAAGVGAISQSDGAFLGMMLGGGLLLPVVSVGLFAALVAALIYAIPLVFFHQADARDALKGSLEAAMRNALPLILFIVIYVVLSFLAMIPLGLGLLVLLPVMSGAVYASYRAVWTDLVSDQSDT